MTTNLLSPDSADFEATLGTWTATQDATPPASPVPLNMLTREQATFEANTTSPASPNRICNHLVTQATFALVPGAGVDGGQCLKLTSTFAGSTWVALQAVQGGAATAPAMNYVAVPGTTYTSMWHFRADAPLPSPLHDITLDIRFFDSANAQIGTPTTALFTIGTNWGMARITAVAPDGAVRFQTSWYSNYTNGQSIYVDRAAVYEGDVTAWFDPGAGWAPNLLVPNSPTPRAELATMETNVNTSGTGRASGWNAWAANQMVEWSTDQAAEGTHSLKLTQLASGINNQPAPRSTGTTIWSTAVTPGKGYTFRASWYTLTQDVSSYAQVQFVDSGGTQVSLLNPTFFSAPGGWREMTAQGIAPAGAAKIGYLIPGNSYAAGLINQVAHLDKAAFYAGYVGAWFSPELVAAARTAGGSHGSWSMGLTRVGPTGTVEAQTATFAATAGKTYTGMATFMTAVARVGRVYVDALDSGGNVLGTTIGAVNTVPGTWATARTTGVAPAGTATVRLRVAVMMVNQGEVVQVDQAGLMDGETTVWAPGGTVVPPSINVIPDPNRHHMAITIRDLTSTAPIKLERILPGGRVEPVRHAQALVPQGAIAFTDDYDVPTDTPFRYRATQGSTVITSDLVTLPSGGTFWLGEVSSGQFIQIIPAANAIPQWTREAPVSVHRVLGRQDPVVVSDVRWWAEGELTHYTLTPNQRNEVGNIWSYGTTLGFYGPVEVIEGIGRLYILASSVDERRVSPRGTEPAREWHAAITQVAEPTGAASVPVLVVWQDVVDSYATWQAVIDGEQDWLDVMQGVPTNETPLPPVGWDW